MTHPSTVPDMALCCGEVKMYFTVEWSESEKLWFGLCSDYPCRVHKDATPDLAPKGIRALVPTPDVEIPLAA